MLLDLALWGQAKVQAVDHNHQKQDAEEEGDQEQRLAQQRDLRKLVGQLKVLQKELRFEAQLFKLMSTSPAYGTLQDCSSSGKPPGAQSCRGM